MFKTLRFAALACSACTIPAQLQAKEGDAPFRLQDSIGSDSFSIGGSVRLRYESFDNDFRPAGLSGADLFETRTIIAAEYQDHGIRIGGELRDSRAWLGKASTPFGTAEVNALEPIQLYVGVDLGGIAGGKSTDLTAGRFLLNLGSKRLAGDPGFRNTGNGFTGLRADWTGKHKESVTLFYTYPQQRLPSDKASILDNKAVWDRESGDLVFWGGFVSVPGAIGPLALELYTYVLDEDDRPDNATRNRQLVTPGFRLVSKPAKGKVDGEFEFAWQSGSIRASSAPAAAKLDVNAYTLSAELGYSFDAAFAPRFSLIADVASGDHAGSASFNRFDPLFGPRRGDWGPTGLFGPLTRSNLVSTGAKLELKPGKRVDAFVKWRNLWLDSVTDSFAKTGVKDSAGASGRHAGHHVEARVRYWLLPKQVQLDIGGAALFKGRFLKDAPNAPATGNSTYGYADLIFSF